MYLMDFSPRNCKVARLVWFTLIGLLNLKRVHTSHNVIKHGDLHGTPKARHFVADHPLSVHGMGLSQTNYVAAFM